MWLSDVSRGDTMDKLVWTFKLYDVNEDGLISKPDLISIIRSIYLLMGKKKESEDDELIREKVDSFFNVSFIFSFITLDVFLFCLL